MKISQIINNFLRGQLDHDLNGRFDLPFYMNGFERIVNFFSNYKGNCKFRPGWEIVSVTKNNNKTRLMEFRFNTAQSYLLAVSAGTIQFYTYDAQGNFGRVINGGNSYEINNSWTWEQIEKLIKAQNADVMNLTMNEITPQKLTRTSANSFTLGNATTTGLDLAALGNPAACAYYTGRFILGGFAKKPTDVAGSETANYENFVIPTSNIKADSPFKYTISDISDPILWLYGGKQNLNVGNNEGICIGNGGSDGTPITSTEVNFDLVNKDAASSAYPTTKDGLMIYVSSDERKGLAFSYDLLTESYDSNDLNMLAKDVTRGKIKAVYFKRDDNDGVWARLGNGKLIYLIYNKAENIFGWFPIETDGFVENICTVTRPDGKDDLFAVILRGDTRYIERMTDEVYFSKFLETPYFMEDTNKYYYNRIIAEELKNCCYLDNSSRFYNPKTASITYDGVDTITSASDVFNNNHVGHRLVYKTATGKEVGVFDIKSFINAREIKVEALSNVYPNTWESFYITFNEIPNLGDQEGKSLSVVGDGGYWGEYTVKDGKIDLDKETTSCWVGKKYMGLLKTFNLGFAENGKNYQTMKKNIVNFILRLVNSAGLKIGTSLEGMEELQLFNPNGLYDNPPLPMDGDEDLNTYGDTSDKEKAIYLMQDKPLPANVTMIEYEINYTE